MTTTTSGRAGPVGATGPSRSPSWDEFKDLKPDPDRRIYDVDGPTTHLNGEPDDIPPFFHTTETYSNYVQWCTWGGVKCSGDVKWAYRARADDDLDAENKPDNHDTELNEIIKHQHIDPLPEPYYDYREDGED